MNQHIILCDLTLSERGSVSLALAVVTLISHAYRLHSIAAITINLTKIIQANSNYNVELNRSIHFVLVFSYDFDNQCVRQSVGRYDHRGRTLT